MRGRKRAIIAALDDLLRRFAPLTEEPDPVRYVRGPALAVAMDWLVRLPEGERRNEAIETLGQAADLAVEALAG